MSQPGIRVLSVASEIAPLIKTGGLADVVGALPAALVAHGIAVTTLVPGYRAVFERVSDLREVYWFADFFGGPAWVFAARAGDLDLLILDAPHHFARPGNPYRGPDGADWADNGVRFAALAHLGALIGAGLLPEYPCDVIHAHDWQTALAPVYLAAMPSPRARSVLTIHNLAFQGQFPRNILPDLGLPSSSFHIGGLEYYGMIGFLKGGILHADKVTTVSPRYAAEIRTQDGGMGLDGLLRARGADVVGILNGIDAAVWNPATDRALAAPYDARSLGRRARNKAAVEARFGIVPGPGPLLAIVSRLTWQKGVDLVLAALPEMLRLGCRLVVLGAGDPDQEGAFRRAAADHPGQIGVVIGHDEALAHLIQAGADAMLMPSRFEPCGLTQLYALRYGCVPLVARVGGLSDTIVDANAAALMLDTATGFQFHPVTQEMFEEALSRLAATFADRKAWAAMQRRGMALDLSWGRSAATYGALFRSLAPAPLPGLEPASGAAHP